MKNFFFMIISLIFIVTIYYINCNLNKNNPKKFKPKKNNTNTLYKSLCYMSDVLTKHKIKHWICHGTLLGAIRSNDIIPFDHDFDLGAFLSDYNKLILISELIKKDGYSLTRPNDLMGIKVNGNKKKIWRISFKIMYKGKAVGDIYLFQSFSDSITRRYDIKTETYFYQMSFQTWFIRKLSKAKIEINTFRVRNQELLLKFWNGSFGKYLKAPLQGGYSDKDYDYFGGYIMQKWLNYYLIEM